ncbi:hypothetical protein ACFFVB_06090 [Formosa undariae]|uniref:DUF2892 domain-containing protein n=1 Tax=Formosa undariae TaxID=1325436 RepID=A0ABV5EZM5_9FLAO
MEHPFYKKPKTEQKRIQGLLITAALVVLLLSIFISYRTGVIIIGILTFSILLSILAPFLDVPAMKASGKLKYHAPLFLSEAPKDGIVTIHGGTLFDYVFVINKKLNSQQRTHFILQNHIQGLLHLIETAKHQDPNLKIRGTSYIINARTANKLGFRVQKLDFIQTVILRFNYFNLLISHSIAKNKLSFPSLKNTRTFETTLQELTARKSYMELLNQKLEHVN